MHNNGSNRLILPDARPVLPPGVDDAGFRPIALAPNGVVVRPFVGGQELTLVMSCAAAAQLGVQLISQAGVLAAAIAQRHNANVAPHERVPEIPNAEASSDVSGSDSARA